MVRRLLASTLFPYTTLFRSVSTSAKWSALSASKVCGWPLREARRRALGSSQVVEASTAASGSQKPGMAREQSGRSEEHTSELQSRLHLVCRLLLEKKKTATS